MDTSLLTAAIARPGSPPGVLHAGARALMVVALLEEIQLLLLRGQVCSRRTGCLSLHVFVHSLVLTVLLWARRADSLMNDPESSTTH